MPVALHRHGAAIGMPLQNQGHGTRKLRHHQPCPLMSTGAMLR
jgi:hypothetical protein